ncbi:unnamed protein product [Rotaria sordida]|uniref:EF-hand domain-containing protein n=1 Tax=Rotaria sordida TaxID=392033 RepID=A0A819QQR8_9BILA|nr:unnamed protein product [Rotaria sordida]
MGQHIEAVQAWEDGLKLLETSVERVDELGEEKIIDWINISLQTAQVVHRLGTDGPGVSHKYQHVCYTPSKMTEAEEAEWKIEQFQKANDGDPQWLYKAAECLWQQEKKEQAYTRLQQLIGTDPTFADAYGMLATYFTEKNDTTNADESMYHQSVCTVKGAANALAGMKHEDIFEVLEYLLPQDTNPIFSMDIPTALGKLGDPKAIPLLMKIIENPMSQANEDSDSSDGIFSSGGKNRLVIESCLALATFFNDEKAKEVLMNGINNQQTREACLAVLCDILEIAALIKASRITEQEIQHWHEDFLNHCPSGRLDKQAFIEYYKKLYPREETNKSIEHIFHMIDVNNDGTVDFHELLIVIVLIDHLNDLESRLSFVFDIWDDSEDEHINQKELENMISAMYDRAGITDRKGDQHPKKRAKEIIAKLDISGDKKLSKEEFIIGCKNDPVIRNLFTPDT